MSVESSPLRSVSRRSSARIARRRIGNALLVGLSVLVTAVALIFLIAILWSLIKNGAGGLNLDVFTKSTPAPGSEGGLLNAILGSLVMCFLGIVIAGVIGTLAGTWLAEYAGDSKYGSVVRFLNDVLLSAPSILMALFVYGLLVKPFHGFSGIAGAVSLALLATPVITRTSEDVLRIQPGALRESAVALGAPLWKAVMAVLWRAARGGMMTGGLLAFARISGESAPLLFTAFNNQFMNLTWKPWEFFGLTVSTANLPVVIYDFALTPYDDLRRLAWVAALLIAFMVLTVTIVARLLTKEDAQR